MADNGEDVAHLLAAGVATPIAELGPDLTEQQSRIVRGEVTITWPYNSVNKSLAFLLAEPDVRLRRAKGLIRVQLEGASAEAVASYNLGGGDEVKLSLDGVSWEKDDAPARPAGSRSDWQLKFSNKIILEAKLADSEEIKNVNIHHTASLEPIEIPPLVQEEPAIPEPVPEIRKVSPPRRITNPVDTGEYASPAFIKRARVSYGALLETDFDEFEDDGGVKGKGRKKPRFSIGGSRWRYQSATPSPEPEKRAERRASSSPEPEKAEPEEQSPEPRRSQMTDEGCQTVEADLTPLPLMTATPTGHDGFPLEPSSPLERHTMANIFAPNTDMGVQTQHTAFVNHPIEQQGHLIQNTPDSYGFDHGLQQPAQTTAIIPSQDEYSVPRFQAAMADPQFGEPEVSLGDQVRFGFSHQPQPIYSQVRDDALVHPGHQLEQIPDAYPETFLEHPSTASQFSGGVREDFRTGEHVSQDNYALGPQQIDQEPLAPSKSSGQQELLLWPIDAPTMDYEHAVAHVSVDAPLPGQDGHHTIKDDLRSNGSEPDEEPFAENEEESEELRAQAALEQPLYRQGETEDLSLAGPENDLQEEDDDISSDEEADYDEDQVGDDYDMRNYADVEDDEEGFESQEEDGPLPDEEMRDEDGEGSYDEDEEGSYDEEDEEDDEEAESAPQRRPLYYAPPSRRPPPPAQSSAPVVIDLISDSEDENDNVQTAPPPRSQFDGPSETVARIVEGPRSVPNAHFQQLNQSTPVTHEASTVDTDLKPESPSYEVESESGSEDADDIEESGASGQSEQESDSADGEVSEEEEDGDDEEIVTIEETQLEVEAELLLSTAGALPIERDNVATLVTEKLSEQIETVTGSPLLSLEVDTVLEEEAGQQLQDNADADRDILMTDGVQDSTDIQVTELHTNELQDSAMTDETTIVQQAFQLGPDIAQEVQDAALMIRTYDRAQDDDQVLPSSPPMTQQFESQVMSKESVLPTSFDSSQPTIDDDGDQLPTPIETQLPDKLSSRSPPQEESTELQVTDEVAESLEPNLQPPVELVSEPSHPPEVDTVMGEITHIDVPEQQDSAEIIPATVTDEDQEAPTADTAMAAENIPPAHSQSDQDQEKPDNVTERTDGDDEDEVQSPRPGKDAVQVLTEKTPVPKVNVAPQEQETSVDQKIVAAAPSPTSQKAEDQDVHEPVEVVQVPAEDKAGQDGPAAGTRRLRSRAPPPPPVDPSIQLARAAIASKRGKRTTEQAPPISPRTTRTRSMSFQKSATPEANDNSVQLARAALKSPSKRKLEHLAEQLRSDLSRRLPVEMPDCISLKLLWSHHNKELDVAAVATTQSTDPSRAKGGPRQYIMSFNVTDPSIAPSEVVEVHFFRAHKDFLPVIKPGDAVLLRGFTVVPLKDKGFGLRSHEESSWAVFEKNDGLAQVRGPPIELGDEEVDYMTTLKKWHAALDKPSQAQLEKANQKFAEVDRAK